MISILELAGRTSRFLHGLVLAATVRIPTAVGPLATGTGRLSRALQPFFWLLQIFPYCVLPCAVLRIGTSVPSAPCRLRCPFDCLLMLGRSLFSDSDEILVEIHVSYRRLTVELGMVSST